MNEYDFEDNILSDLDSTETETKFNEAADYLQHLVNKLDANTLLEFYGLYKQSTIGSCNTSKPGIFNLQARSKWSAWNDLGKMDKEVAMRKYIMKLNEVEPDWDHKNSDSTRKAQKKPSWISVSTPMADSEENNKPNEMKTLIDHVKDENIDEILAFFSSSLSVNQNADRKCDEINKYDNEGLAAIHWASDRGYVNILEILLDRGADVNLVDKESGQTALHYAIDCGHLDCVKILLKHGANPEISDSDDVTCVDLASDDPSILELLKT